MNNELAIKYANEKIDENLVTVFNFLLETAKSVNSKNASIKVTDELTELFNKKDYDGIKQKLENVKELLDILDNLLGNCISLEEKIKKLSGKK